MKKQLITIYLDYVNDYLTVAKMAYDYQLPENVMSNLIDNGRTLHEMVCRGELVDELKTGRMFDKDYPTQETIKRY